MTETTVVLVRHGRTAWHEGNRYLGLTDLPIDAHGECQARALAAWAAGRGFTSLVCSSLTRARATMAPVAAQIGLPVRVDERLRELDFGVAEGRTLAELRSAEPAIAERFVADPDAGHFPGGEAPTEAVARAMDAISDAIAADPGGRILVVAHNTLMRLLTCSALGVPLCDYRRRLPRIEPAATVTLLFGESRQPALLAYNVPVPGDCEDAPERFSP
jgi:probable phosphoglycerate mutase